jgi:hypothetical protein
MTIEWGNVADWLAWVGTVAALLLGLLLLWREVRENRVRHASRVVAWIDDEAEAACVRNGGEKPVTYVMPALFTEGHCAEPSSGQAGTTPHVASRQWLASGEAFQPSPNDPNWHARLFPPTIRLEFTDASGRRWLRGEKGQLSPKKVKPFRQDRRLARKWRHAERETATAREMFTCWEWPTI